MVPAELVLILTWPLYKLVPVPTASALDVLFQKGTRQTWVLEFADLERIDFDEAGL